MPKKCLIKLKQTYPQNLQIIGSVYCLSQDSSCVLSGSFALSKWHLHIFFLYFESIETNRTKMLQKRWCTRLKIGVEGVLGEEKHLHIHRLSFCLLFLKIAAKVLFNFYLWPVCTCIIRISQTRDDDTFWCMQWHQEVIAELIAIWTEWILSF